MSTVSQEKELKKAGANIKVYHPFKVNIKNPNILVEGVDTPQPDTIYAFAIKKPNATERDIASETRSQYTSYYMEKGLLPEAVLRKKLSDLGGVVSQTEGKSYLESQLQLLTLESEYQLLKSEGKEEESKVVFAQWNDTKRRIIAFETEQNMSLENSAEAKARDKMIQYYIYQLLYWLPKPDSTDYVPYFTGKDFEEKTAYAYNLDDNEDALYHRVVPLTQLFISYMLYSRGPANPDDINALPKEMGLE